MCIERIAVRYKRIVFKATLPIYRELLPYILYTTYSIRLDNWAKYSAIALIAQKNSHNFIPKAYVLWVLGLILYYKRLNVTDLITAVVRLLRRDMNGLVETALGELEPVEPWDKG